MNRKQLIVVWITLLLICSIIWFAPKKYVRHRSEGRTFVTDDAVPYSMPVIQWDFVLQRSLVVLLVGGLLFYTLKKKWD